MCFVNRDPPLSRPACSPFQNNAEKDPEETTKMAELKGTLVSMTGTIDKGLCMSVCFLKDQFTRITKKDSQMLLVSFVKFCKSKRESLLFQRQVISKPPHRKLKLFTRNLCELAL